MSNYIKNTDHCPKIKDSQEKLEKLDITEDLSDRMPNYINNFF
jgi:hypothetical protein